MPTVEPIIEGSRGKGSNVVIAPKPFVLQLVELDHGDDGQGREDGIGNAEHDADDSVRSHHGATATKDWDGKADLAIEEERVKVSGSRSISRRPWGSVLSMERGTRREPAVFIPHGFCASADTTRAPLRYFPISVRVLFPELPDPVVKVC